MMMTMLSEGARRRRRRGRLFLTVLAAGVGFCGGAWAMSGRLGDSSRARIADDMVRAAARGLGDALHHLADRPRSDLARPMDLAGGPPPPALRILVTDAWASPRSHLPMPPERLGVQGS